MPSICSRMKSRLVSEMVTTRITEAVPITMPSAGEQRAHGVRAQRLKAESDRLAEEHADLAAARLAEQLLRVGARRIVGREVAREVALEKLAGDVEMAAALDVEIGLGEKKAWGVGRDLLCCIDGLVGLLVTALAGQAVWRVRSVCRSAAEPQPRRAPKVHLGGAVFLALLRELGLRPETLCGIQLRHARGQCLRLIEARRLGSPALPDSIRTDRSSLPGSSDRARRPFRSSGGLWTRGRGP